VQKSGRYSTSMIDG